MIKEEPNVWHRSPRNCLSQNPVALLVAVPKRFCTSRLAMALQKIPYTFLLMAGNIFKLRGANKTFIHTRHGVAEK
jgi:hypothetical protein